MSSHRVHLVKGPAVVSLEGMCQVLGKDVANSEVSVDVGKILPFEISSDCKINIRGGESWLASSSTAGTSIWREVIQKIFYEKVFLRTILIVGDRDTGKSTLAVYIINEALKNGFRPCVIDADIGQGDIAPPNAVGGAVIMAQITDLRDVNMQFFEFVGSINPAGFEDVIINAIKNIINEISTLCNTCIINTDGYIRNNGIDYKVRMAKELRPDLVVCLGDVSIYDTFRAKYDSSPILYGKSPSNTIKSRIDRRQRRLNQFLRYVSESCRSKVTSKELKEIKFVYKRKMYCRVRIGKYGSLHLVNRNGSQINGRKLVNMFVALGSNKTILGFGIVLKVSRHRVYLKSDVRDFNEIYLSNSRISEDNISEFRLVN